jgi:hypothetical protein
MRYPDPRTHGRAFLLAAAILPLAAGSARAQQLPPAREIVERYVEAIGGREAVSRPSQRHTVIEMSAMGMTMTMETWQARPNLMLTRTQMPGVGPTTTGYDGRTAWSVDPMQGARLLVDAELQQTLLMADFDAQTDLEKSYPTMETLGQRQVEGQACWNVKMVHVGGVESQNCFDVQTGLLIGTTSTAEGPMGPISVEQVLADYQDFDGVKMPTRTTASMMGQMIVSAVKSVSHEPFDASVFALPPEIRALAGTD